MNATLTFAELLAALAGVRLLRSKEEPAVIAYDDPRKDPNWCWTHNMLWPACAGMH